jgi:lipopolysaccharide export system permease protein
VSLFSRYVVGRFLRVLFSCWLSAGLLLFLIEAFGKVASLDSYHASAAAITAYLVLKIPNLLLDAYPATTLLAVLLSLGLLARGNEILAARACGISPWQIVRSMLVAALAVSALALAWTEFVVPSSSSRSRMIRDTVIKGREHYGGAEGAAIWVRTATGFVRVEYYDRDHDELLGVTLFQPDASMQLYRVVHGRSARWDGKGWKLEAGTVRTIDGDGRLTSRVATDADFALEESPVTFEKRQPKPREMTYRELSRFIGGMDARGAVTAELRLERHLRFAWPATGLVAVLIGVPLAVRGGRDFGIGYNVALGLFVGFFYWVCFAVCASAGRSGGITPVLAAWGPNAVFAVIGLGLLRRRDA